MSDPHDGAERRRRFPREVRLLRSSDFDTVFAARLSAGDGVLVVHARLNGLTHPRLGLVVSRKVGKAVLRNRWKRVLRAAFRLQQHELPAWDIVCLPRSRDAVTLAAVSRSMSGLLARVQKKADKRNAASRERDSDAG